MNVTRRKLIQGGLGLSALGGLALLKPGDNGAGHSEYFERLSQAIKQAELTRPTLILDKQKMTQNIHTLSQHIGQRYDYRMVVKSLPSIPMLEHIVNETGSRRFMVFNEQFLLKISEHFARADILLGKPLPALGAKKTLEQLNRQSGSSIRWLVDNPQRLQHYKELAVQRRQGLRINLELDIGLHRGGFASSAALEEALKVIKAEPFLEFDGLMGYEPHIVKVPGSAQAHLADALDLYHRHIELTKSVLGQDFPQSPLFNTAGSPTYQLHTKLNAEQSRCNELSAGSCLVKPTDFDLPSLADHIPASFIATPVLKSLDQTEIPGVPGLGKLMAWWNPNRQRSLFTYGGNWKAKPVSPKGLSYNPLYGRSSNQEMINASHSNPLSMNDWVFLRPTQSEAVFLQFGDIAVYDGNKLTEQWPVFS